MSGPLSSPRPIFSAPANPTGNPNFNLKNRPEVDKSGPGDLNRGNNSVLSSPNVSGKTKKRKFELNENLNYAKFWIFRCFGYFDILSLSTFCLLTFCLSTFCPCRRFVFRRFGFRRFVCRRFALVPTKQFNSNFRNDIFSTYVMFELPFVRIPSFRHVICSN
jgi:hypothetical protein